MIYKFGIAEALREKITERGLIISLCEVATFREVAKAREVCHISIVCQLFPGQEQTAIRVREIKDDGERWDIPAVTELCSRITKNAVAACWDKVTTSPGASG